jgi:hypothetical protein
MYTKNYYELMDKINVVINHIERALLAQEQVVNFTLEDQEDKIIFGFKKEDLIQHLLLIPKADENSLKEIYSAMVGYYENCVKVGSITSYRNFAIQWELTPVIGDKVMVEVISTRPEDQRWFAEEMLKSQETQKGLK